MSKVAEILKGNELIERFADVSPSWMEYKAEMGFAVQILGANSYLAEIAQKNPSSLQQAMTNVAACGLSLNPALKEAYLVPRKGKVCFDPSYMGLCKLATDTGSVVWVQTRVVKENDEFILHDIGQPPTHNVDPFSERGAVTGVYCVAKIHDGSFLTGTMSIAEVYAIRARSEAYKADPKKTPWFTDEEEMIKKTIAKRDKKMWPRSNNHEAERRLAKAVQTSHDNEDVILATSSPDLGQYTDEAKAYFDQVLESKDALEMFVLSETTSANEFAGLHNSFPKSNDLSKEQKEAGVKGRGHYKEVVNGMLSAGKKEFETYLEEFQQGGDITDLSETAQELIESRAT